MRFWYLSDILRVLVYIHVNILTVVSGCFPVFLGWTRTKQRNKCLAQEHISALGESQSLIQSSTLYQATTVLTYSVIIQL